LAAIGIAGMMLGAIVHHRRAGDTWPTLPSILMLVLSLLYIVRLTGTGPEPPSEAAYVDAVEPPICGSMGGQPVRRMPPIGHQVRIVRQTPATGAHMKKVVDWPWPKPAVQINREELR
jgi:hypothetical protein